MPRECEHGSLRRSCERCADAEEIDELRANRDRAVRLLHLAMAQLRRWNDAYGAHAVPWLPPAGYVRLAEDVDEFTAGLQGPNDVVRAAVSTMLALGSDFPREELNLRDVELVAQFVAAPSAPAEEPQQRPALVDAMRGLLASLSRDPTEQELRAAAHEFTVRADRLAAARTHREDVDG